jgi:hypothetical protein
MGIPPAPGGDQRQPYPDSHQVLENMTRLGNGLIYTEDSQARLRRNLKEKFRLSGRMVGKEGSRLTNS